MNLIKDTTATIMGALVELTKRASGIDTDAKLTELAKEIRKLREDNKVLQEKYERLYSSYEDKEARESIRTGTPLQNSTRVEEKSQKMDKDGLQKASLPLKGGEALRNPGKENPSRSRPSKNGENLGRKREQRVPRLPIGGETLSPQGEEREMEMEVETVGNDQGTASFFQKEDFPRLGKREIRGTSPRL